MKTVVQDYNSKLKNWDDVASVRVSREQYNIEDCLLSEGNDQLTWSLEKFTPVFEHEYLLSLDPSAKQYVMALQLLEFVEKTTRLELEYVNAVATNISLNKYPFELPHQLILDAIKINTDEAYHAYFSEKVRYQIAAKYKENNLSRYVSIFFDKLSHELDKLHAEKRYLGLLATVVIAPTTVPVSAWLKRRMLL